MPFKLIDKLFTSEKTQALLSENKYVFLVYKKANKSELKKEIEKTYKVDVLKINMVSIPGDKLKKKAIVAVRPGQTIKENIKEKNK